MPRTRSHGNDAGSDYARFLGLGFTFIAALGVFAGIGFLLDKLLGTLPIFLLVGLGGGFAVGMYYVYLELKKLGSG